MSFVTAIKLNKYVIKWMDDFLHLFIFLIIYISEDAFMVVYCSDRSKSQRTCNEAADDYLAALKLIPDWFLTSIMLEKLDNALHANDYILFYSEHLDKVTFTANQRHILAVNLDKVNPEDDNSLDEDDSHTIIHFGVA